MQEGSEPREAERLQQEVAHLRDRLTGLSEAMLRINESLEIDNVLNEVAESARVLSNALFSGITVKERSGHTENFVSAGLTSEEQKYFLDLSPWSHLWANMSDIDKPMRMHDIVEYVRLLGMPDFRPPIKIGPALMAPIRKQGEQLGTIYLARLQGEDDFSREDEETLLMFASQAALVIENAQRYLNEQRARTDMETLIETSPVGVVVLDADTGQAMWVNLEARRLASGLTRSGMTVEQLFKQLTFRRGNGQVYSLADVPMARLLQENLIVRAEEITLVGPEGDSVNVIVNSTPIPSTEGTVRSVVVTLQDMTPVEELERMRVEFLSMVSHELRTPLTAIKGAASTLVGELNALDSIEIRQYHQMILDQVEKMRALISDLLDVNNIETGSLSVELAPLEVSDLVEEARTAFFTGAADNSLAIELPSGVPPVMADRRRVVQVISNLLSNAANHSPKFSHVTIAAAQRDDMVAITIIDQGEGIPADRLPHLFRKYYRLEGRGGRNVPTGSGLGLAICKGLVEAHGGRIWAESAGPGTGSRFVFTLPVAHTADEGGSVSKSPLAGTGQVGRGEPPPRVLIGDDDPQTLRYVRDILTRSGYEPVVAASPEEVVRLAREETPDLAVLDMVFPGADGIEVMEEIRKTIDLPVIFLSAYGQEDIIVRAFNAGAMDYVSKPFSPNELDARIRAALRKWKQVSSVSRESFSLGELLINYGDRLVTLAGRDVRLTPMEYDLLCELSYHPGRVLTHHYLLSRVWGLDQSTDAGTVRTTVKRLRQKLGDNAHRPRYIFSEPRVGYRLAASADG